MKKSLIFYSQLFVLLSSNFLSGCVVPYYVPPKSPANRVDLSSIRIGITTKEDIFLNFGNPFDKVSNDERLFAVTLASRGSAGTFVVVGGGYSVIAFPVFDKTIFETYEIEIEFDENDVVKRCDLLLQNSKMVDRIRY